MEPIDKGLTGEEVFSESWSKRFSFLILILANLVPLVGVLWFGWDLLSVLLLYWLESLLVSLLALGRVLRVGGIRSIGSISIFLLVVAVLSGVHLIVIGQLASAIGLPGPRELDVSVVTELPLLSALRSIYRGGLLWILQERPELLQLAFPALVFSHLTCILSWRRRAPGRSSETATVVMKSALTRLIVLHLAILGGAALMAMRGVRSMLPVLAALIVLKILMEMRWQKSEI